MNNNKYKHFSASLLVHDRSFTIEHRILLCPNRTIINVDDLNYFFKINSMIYDNEKTKQ